MQTQDGELKSGSTVSGVGAIPPVEMQQQAEVNRTGSAGPLNDAQMDKLKGPEPTQGPAMKAGPAKSYGHKAVTLPVDNGSHGAVNMIKQGAAEFINFLNDQRLMSSSPEAKRLLSKAITDVQSGTVFAIMGVTWID